MSISIQSVERVQTSFKTVPLGSVASVIMGQSPPGDTYNDVGDGIPLIAGAGDFSGNGIRAKKFTTKPTKRVAPGEIVLSIRASIGARVRTDDVYCLGRGVAAILPESGRLDGQYLWHWLEDNRHRLAAKGRGATFLQVSRADIAELEIPLLPIPEQRRIAAILDLADELCAKLRMANDYLDELVSAKFIELFGDPVSSSKFERKPIREMAHVVTGNTPSRSDPENFGNDLEWIKADNLGTGAWVATRSSEGLSHAGRLKARTVPAGSVLVTCIAGSPNSIGNAAVVDRDVAFNQQINAIVPGQGADSRFLLHHMRLGKALVQNASTGGMKGLVSKSRFESIELLAPPMAVQSEFASFVATMEKLKTKQASLEAYGLELFASLQHRAFTGKL